MKPVEYKNALSAPKCEELINLFENSNPVYRNKGAYRFKELLMDGGTMEGTREKSLELQMHLIQTAEQHVRQFLQDYSINTFPQQYGYEAVRIKRYDFGDEFRWHADVMDYDSARRFMVIMFYLNDAFSGGETDFGSEQGIDHTVNPETGKAVIFTPFWDNPHRGREIISGSKYIANVYLHLL